MTSTSQRDFGSNHVAGPATAVLRRVFPFRYAFFLSCRTKNPALPPVTHVLADHSVNDASETRSLHSHSRVTRPLFLPQLQSRCRRRNRPLDVPRAATTPWEVSNTPLAPAVPLHDRSSAGQTLDKPAVPSPYTAPTTRTAIPGLPIAPTEPPTGPTGSASSLRGLPMPPPRRPSTLASAPAQRRPTVHTVLAPSTPAFTAFLRAGEVTYSRTDLNGLEHIFDIGPMAVQRQSTVHTVQAALPLTFAGLPTPW